MTDTLTPDPGTLGDLERIEAQRQAALIDVDLDTLAELFDDSLVHIHAPGVSMTKPQLLEHTATRAAYLAIDRGPLTTRLFGDIAIVTGPITNRLRTKEGGERTLAGVATQVLRRGGRHGWRYLSFQMTPFGEQAWPSLPSEQSHQNGSR